jgi:hypothetical protein
MAWLADENVAEAKARDSMVIGQTKFPGLDKTRKKKVCFTSLDAVSTPRFFPKLKNRVNYFSHLSKHFNLHPCPGNKWFSKAFLLS